VGRYLPLLEALDRWQAEARDHHPGVIPCRAGCSHCCYGPFDVSVADIALILEGAAALAPEVRAAARERAERQVALMRGVEPSWQTPFDVADLGERRFDRLTDALAREPCPLLGPAGECLIYRHRPAVCRMIGLGLRTEAGDVIPNTCPIQDRFPGYASLPPAEFPLLALEEDETLAKREAAATLFGTPAREGYETTIAAALVTFDLDRGPES
jgi:Fe-S-cluster containining protein